MNSSANQFQLPTEIKSALVHEWFVNYAGAERVAEALLGIMPEADVFALTNFEGNYHRAYLNGRNIHTSFIQHLPFAKKSFRNYFPLFPLAVEQHDLRKFELIVSSSHLVSKGIITAPHQLHICYCHSPVRYAWDLYHQYLEESNLQKGLKGMLAKWFLHKLRNWDYISAVRPDFYIANSNFIAKRIKKVWNREADVIYPPVALDRFQLTEKKDNFYFTASRLVPYKKIDLIVEAFTALPHLKLVVAGDGPQLKLIKSKAGKNIEILNEVPQEEFSSLMQNAKAFVFAAEEDFGITMVEALSAGTPVIAYQRGGASEIVSHNASGLLFENQDVNSLKAAIEQFERKGVFLSPSQIAGEAKRFSTDRFQKEMNQYIVQKYDDFKSR